MMSQVKVVGSSAWSRWALPAAVCVVVGCGEGFTEPEFKQVIEEVEFDASLNIDLAQMERLESGVYVQVLVVGDGEELVDGLFATVEFTAWVSTGEDFGEGEFIFLVGSDPVVDGFAIGVAGQRVGETRLIIIPPDLGYGTDGAVMLGVPGGAILIFRVELLSLSETLPPA